MKEELKQAIKIEADIYYADPLTKGVESNFHAGVQAALSTPSILRHADPEIMKQAGWESSEWISVEDRLPEINLPVLVQYYKHKKGNWSGNKGNFFTQAYYVEREHFYLNGTSMRLEKSWYDYTDRLIWDTQSNSKNKVTHWKPLPNPPKQ